MLLTRDRDRCLGKKNVFILSLFQIMKKANWLKKKKRLWKGHKETMSLYTFGLKKDFRKELVHTDKKKFIKCLNTSNSMFIKIFLYICHLLKHSF